MVVWTEAGDLSDLKAISWDSFGIGGLQLGPSWRARTSRRESVPRLVDSLVGKKVIGAAAGQEDTSVWTDAGGRALLIPLGWENHITYGLL